MIIYLSLIIPIIAIIALFIKGKGCLTFWEAGVMLAIPLVFIFVFKAIVDTIQVTDTEWWGNYTTQAMYYEDWDEKVSCRHPKYCTRSVTKCSGSGKSKSCHSETESYQCGWQHAFDVDYHPEEWVLTDDSGNSRNISKQKFEELAIRWNNHTFVDMNRNYYSNDGDAYKTVYDNVFENTEPVVTEHSYENRVASSDSIFNFRELSQEEVKNKNLFEYPPIYDGYKQKALLGLDDSADVKFQAINGLLGKSKEVKVLILIWKNKPMDAAFDQQRYWKNGNKNEFVINIGVDDAFKIRWTFVFSWTPSEGLKIATQNFIRVQEILNLNALADWLKPELEAKWKRKHFRDFSYITVEPPTWAVITTFIITVLMTGGIGFWCVINEHKIEYDEDAKSIFQTIKDKIKSFIKKLKSRIQKLRGKNE